MRFTFFGKRYRLFKRRKTRKKHAPIYVDALTTTVTGGGGQQPYSTTNDEYHYLSASSLSPGTSPIALHVLDAQPQTDPEIYPQLAHRSEHDIEARRSLRRASLFPHQPEPDSQTDMLTHYLNLPPHHQAVDVFKPLILVDQKPHSCHGPDMKRIEQLAKPTERRLKALYEERGGLENFYRKPTSVDSPMYRNVSVPEKKSKTNFLNYEEYLKNFSGSIPRAHGGHFKRMFRRVADCYYVIKNRDESRYAGPLLYATSISEIQMNRSSEICQCESCLSLIRRLCSEDMRRHKAPPFFVDARSNCKKSASLASISSSVTPQLKIMESSANGPAPLAKIQPGKVSDIDANDNAIMDKDQYRLMKFAEVLKRKYSRKCRYIK